MNKQGKGWWSESQEDLQQCLPTVSILWWDAQKEGWRMQWGGPCSRGTHALEGGVQIQACQGPKTSVWRGTVITSAWLETPLATPAVIPYVVWKPWNPHDRAPDCLEPLLFLFQLQCCGVMRRITPWRQGVAFSAVFCIFCLSPCPLFQSKMCPCTASWQCGHSPACASCPRTSPRHMGGDLPFSPNQGRNSELSVGVLRLHTGQDMPRERGCVGFTGEVSIQSRNTLLKQFSTLYRKVSFHNPLCSTSTDTFRGPWLCGQGCRYSESGMVRFPVPRVWKPISSGVWPTDWQGQATSWMI